MPGIDRDVICHRLSVSPTSKPVKQKQRHLSVDRCEFVKGEVKVLLSAGHIREVTYPEWVANVVLVPKPQAWRKCIDYTDLNRACPLDPYPLPSIHQMVDETAGAELMSFMDAFKGYHQIMMAEADEEKTAFVTPDGLYCYRVMPFGLRNAGATYQRMINSVFEGLLGRSMEAYIDDMLVKSTVRADHPGHLRACFQVMREHRLRLNPKKCTFSVQTGKFLGYMMTRRGIELNPAKIRAILDMKPPTSIREVQQLTGRLAALSRFLSKLADRAHPFFKILKKSNGFTWDDDSRAAFEDLKAYLASPIVLSKPEPGEDLEVYLAISDRAVSAVLCRVDHEGVQRPVYYVSHALQGPEFRYTRLEKVVFALVTAAKRLTPYFQGWNIRVLTDQPIGAILRTSTSSGRLVKWAMMLTQFALEYKPRPSIKAQALADFMVECTARDTEADQNNPHAPEWWEVSTDGSSGKKGTGAGMVITTPEGFKAYYAILLHFSPTNNEAEYEALIAGLLRARQLGAKAIRAKTDSALVVGQVNGEFVTNGDKLMIYKDRVLAVLRQFEAHELTHIPRSDNADADMLSRLVHEAPEHISKITHIEEAVAPCIDSFEVEPVGVEQDPWITDLKEYLQDGKMPEEEDRARKVRLRAPRFQIVDDRLYRRSYGGPLMRCLNAFEADIVTDELHSGLYGQREVHPIVCGIPQGNGQVENANRTILDGLKKKLFDAGRSWADELPYVLWAYRTTPREATKETPFALVYGAEARLPIKAWIPTSRERGYDEANNERMMIAELDAVEERREVAARRIVEYQNKIKQSRDLRVRPRYFQVGDYVLRERKASRPNDGGKFAQTWEGPYVISAVIRPGTYKLETTTGRPVDRILNSEHLVLFHH
ncbi:uncharacterized protein LOC115999523 [Ipomoea triloba]|uniref:uncharacterized protein LOC115999523 n=1 Tax=Ipomoea triloba TaxID=35885 RepID=UPI00125D5487|nr:uncharacterized protein LOC115999523 [Ipomoea triloba]